MNSLAGKRVLVTRPREQASALIERLTALGAVPVVFPTIEIAPVEENSDLDRAIQGLGSYQWVIFTSVNGVEAFWQRLRALGNDVDSFHGVRVAAIGPATAQALSRRGVTPDFVPAEYVAEAILPGLGALRGQRILLARADIARKTLFEALQAQGALVEEIPIYTTRSTQPDEAVYANLEQGIDIATFTSSSTVRNFFALLRERALPILDGAVIACIGPITAGTAREYGLTVDVVAEEYTVEGLVQALLKYEVV